MKLAIPLDENQKDICPSFARAPFMLFYENETLTVADNPAADAPGGAGTVASQFLLDSGVDTLITPRLGENAAQVLQAAEVKIYKSQGNDAKENIRACLDGKLQPLTQFHAGYHGIR